MDDSERSQSRDFNRIFLFFLYFGVFIMRGLHSDMEIRTLFCISDEFIETKVQRKIDDMVGFCHYRLAVGCWISPKETYQWIVITRKEHKRVTKIIFFWQIFIILYVFIWSLYVFPLIYIFSTPLYDIHIFFSVM